MTRRRRPRGAALLAALALLLTTLAVPARAATAHASTASGVTLTVTSLTPVAATDGTTLTVRGTVRNGSPAALSELRLVLGIGVPIVSRDGLLADFTTAPPIDQVLTDCDTCAGRALAAGADETYTISLPLPRSLDEGRTIAYPLIVRAVSDGDGLGEADTFLPYVPGTVTGPLRVSWLIPLTHTPVLDASGAVDASDFPTVVDSRGTLASLLATTRAPATTHPVGDQPGYAPVTLAVDPAVVAAAQVTARSGWRRVGETGRGRAADPGSAAFLTDLAQDTEGQGVLALPYADPDAVAVTRAGLGLDLSQAVATGRSALHTALPGAQVLTGVGDVPGSAVDRATLDTYADAGVTTLVVPGGQLPPTTTSFPPTQTAVTTIGTTGPSIRALVTDPDAENLLEAAGHDAPTPRMAAERLLALLAVIVGEAPNDQQVRSIVLALPRDATVSLPWLRDALSDTGSVPWLRAVPLGSTSGYPAGSREPLGVYPASAQAAELPQSTLTGPGGVSALRTAVTSLYSALPDPVLTRPLDLALLQAESYAWRTDPAGADEQREAVAHRVASLLGGIRLEAAPSISLGSRSASIPVTVEDSLDEPVRVTVQLLSPDRTKLRVSDRTVTVAAGTRQRVLLAASTERAGTFRASIALTLPSGERVQDVPITVHSHAYGGLSLGITLGALAVLLLALVVRAVRRIRRRRTA